MSRKEQSAIFAYRPIYLFIFIFVLLTEVLVFFMYKEIKQRSEHAARLDARAGLDSIVERLNLHTSLATETIQSMAHLLEQTKSVGDIESVMPKILRASPETTVYGIGVWSKEHTLVPSRRLYGPYWHRDVKQGWILTREWETEAYNFPKQNWYLSGVPTTIPTFLEPYFDTGIVYVSLVRNFSDRTEQVKGVLTVDMIIPQLDQLIENLNSDGELKYYVLSKEGHVLAHPLKALMIKKLGPKATEADLLGQPFSVFDEIEKQAWGDDSFELESEVVQGLGWTVVARIETGYLHRDSKRVLIVLLGSGISLLSLMFFAAFTIRRIGKALDIARAASASSAKMASLGEMAGGVAHEINNPLAILSMTAEQMQDLLQEENIPKKLMQDKLLKIQKTVERISVIVRGLKSFSRDGSQDPFEPVQVGFLLADSLALCRERFNNHSVNIEVGEMQNLAAVSCRPVQISQVILNLLNNSFDAIETQPDKWIRIDARVIEAKEAKEQGLFASSITAKDRLQKFVRITISDSGRLDKSLRVKLFQPFFTTKPVGKGTGLGLSISRTILESHHGRLSIDLKSEHTTFYIDLPLAA